MEGCNMIGMEAQAKGQDKQTHTYDLLSSVSLLEIPLSGDNHHNHIRHGHEQHPQHH